MKLNKKTHFPVIQPLERLDSVEVSLFSLWYAWFAVLLNRRKVNQ